MTLCSCQHYAPPSDMHDHQTLAKRMIAHHTACSHQEQCCLKGLKRVPIV